MAFSRSLIPSMFSRSWFDTYDYPTHLWDQHFGTGLSDNNLYPPMFHSGYLIRPRTRASVQSSGLSEVNNDENKFQVMLNVQHFKPEELEVKVVENFVVIHGKHEEKTDEHGFIQREFTRRYMLPDGIEEEKLKSSLSANGVLTIKAPKMVMEPLPSNERVVRITMSTESSENKKS